MEKEIIISCREEETDVAIIEDKRVVEMFVERESQRKTYGNIYLGLVEQVNMSLEAAFVNVGLDKAAYLPFRETEFTRNKPLKKSDKVLLQITKEPISGKCYKSSMHISLPGRYLVHVPNKKYLGISKSISNVEERKRLRKIFKQFNYPGGFIVRTEAQHLEKDVFVREINYLTGIWKDIALSSKKAKAPSLVYKDLGLIFKIVRDKLSTEVKSLLIDSSAEYKALLSYTEMVSRDYAKKIVHYKSKVPILKAYKVDKALESIMKQTIYLKSGGYIIIQEAESLCAIDVNTGRTKGVNLEEVSFKTNLEAVQESLLQLRLRNIGGIIVIDFVDMHQRKHREAVLAKLQQLAKNDKAKIKILPITVLGLVEMTRERKKESLVSYFSMVCPCCKGSGRIFSVETIYLKIKQSLQEIGIAQKTKVKIIVNPKLKSYFTKHRIKNLKSSVGSNLQVIFDYKVDLNNYEIIYT